MRREVREQEKELGLRFDYIVVCTVTGSTHAGMIVGFAKDGRSGSVTEKHRSRAFRVVDDLREHFAPDHHRRADSPGLDHAPPVAPRPVVAGSHQLGG